ncbi:MAG: DUF4358 domain-containing protein, partial [Oscillospiraceae bacterium]|nr:DUF4358 domain-containing protein [Oscillospiraceae bacterium]
MTDQALVELFSARSEEAVPALQAQYGPYCRAVAAQLLSDPRDVDECLNDAWLAVWRAIPPARPEHFKGWLAAIVRNRALAMGRESSRRPPTGDGAALELLDGGDPDALNAYLKDAYGVDPGLPEDCAVARGTGASAFEIAVLRFSDSDASRDVEKRLNSYLDAREGQLSGSDQSDMLYQALVISSEPYLVLLACENAEGGGMAFTKAAGTSGYGYSMRHQFPSSDPDYPDRCKFTPPNQDDMSLYDTAAIRAAWEAGDPSPLSRYDRDIYNAAQKVLGKILRGGMGDLEKETAIYGWLVNNVDYDWTHQNIMATTPRESFTPYGGLVNHTAVCLGYATSFQLLCDLAGVECITVAGAAFSSREDHGWNMVRLDGAWYCVDATWDANSREMGFAQSKEKDWDYFNVTSDYMALSNHQWDYANTPEA